MNKGLEALKEIIDNQQTVRTSRLESIYKDLLRAITKKDKKINGQRKQLENLNARYQRAWELAEKRKHLSEELESLKRSIRTLRIEHQNLQEAHTKLKKKKNAPHIK